MSGGIARAVLAFVVAQALLIAGVAWAVQRFIWTGASDAHAILVSAGVAIVVQALTFAIVRLVAREQVIAAWGMGVLVRFAVVAVWAFVAIPALGLAAGPALLSLVLFFFVSTLVEPLFLNVR